MAEMTTNQFEAAKARGEERLRGPRASSAHYDAGRDRVIVRLTTGAEIDFAPRDAEGLQHATREDLAEIEVEALGLGIHFSRLDADLYVPVLLEGVLGSKSWMAARLGAPGRCGRPGARQRQSCGIAQQRQARRTAAQGNDQRGVKTPGFRAGQRRRRRHHVHVAAPAG